MRDDFENVYDMLEHAIEYAFEGKMQLKFYEFLKYRKTTKAEVDAFLKSSTAKEIADEVLELKEYIKGGNDSDHKQLREAYHHIPKPKARKIKVEQPNDIVLNNTIVSVNSLSNVRTSLPTFPN